MSRMFTLVQRTIAVSLLTLAACSPFGPPLPDALNQQADAHRVSSDAAMHSDDAAMHPGDAAMHSDDAAMHSDDAAMLSFDAATHSNDAAILTIDAATHSSDAAALFSIDAAIHSNDAASLSDDAAIHADDAAIHADDAAIHADDAAILDAARDDAAAQRPGATPLSDAAATFDAAPLTDAAPPADAAPSAPVIMSLSPTTENLLGGDVIQLVGTGFTGATTVTFDGISGTSLILNSDSRLSVVAPAHGAGLVDVVVFTPNGSATLTAGFSYGPGPIINDVGPLIVPSFGGTIIDVIGSNLASTISVILENGSHAAVNVISDNEVQWTTPIHPPGASVATVTTLFGSTTIDLQFDAVPTAGGITPSHGSLIGGTEVTLVGADLTDTVSVSVCGTATLFSVISDTVLTFVTPANAAGLCDVIITTLGGTASVAGGFTFDELLSISAISPAQASINGGTTVTIAGHGFTNVTAVDFGTTPGLGLTILSDSGLTVIAPPGGVGTVDITVSSSDDTSATTPADQFTYGAPPVILSVSPSSAPYTGGIPITIRGSGFTGVSVVRFDLPNGQGGAGFHNFTIVSDSEIDIPSPNYFSITTTNVIVDSPFGEGEDDGAFTFTNPVN